MSVDQNVEDNADCESPACAFDRENSCHNTGESALGICVDHAESDLAADKALHDKIQRQSCRKDRSTLSCPAIISIGIMRKRKDIPVRPCLPKRSRFLFAMVSESKNMIRKAV